MWEYKFKNEQIMSLDTVSIPQSCFFIQIFYYLHKMNNIWKMREGGMSDQGTNNSQVCVGG